MMLTIGFVDDDRSLIVDYQTRLKRKNIELVFAENCTTKEDIVEWILSNNLKCVLIDYKLTSAYNFLGTDLVAYLNTELPDLPCIILTNYPEEGVNENLVLKYLIIDRGILDATDLDGFVQIIKQAINVFDNRLKLHLIQFIELKNKKANHDITAIEEEKYLSLYKILRAYHEVDDIPVELLKTDTNTKMDDILSKLNLLIINKE